MEITNESHSNNNQKKTKTNLQKQKATTPYYLVNPKGKKTNKTRNEKRNPPLCDNIMRSGSVSGS